MTRYGKRCLVIIMAFSFGIVVTACGHRREERDMDGITKENTGTVEENLTASDEAETDSGRKGDGKDAGGSKETASGNRESAAAGKKAGAESEMADGQTTGQPSKAAPESKMTGKRRQSAGGKVSEAGQKRTTEPTQGPAGPEQEPTRPAQEPTGPTEESTGPAQEPSEPTQEPIEPSQEPTEPSQEPTEPTQEPTEPSTEPSEEPDHPLEATVNTVRCTQLLYEDFKINKDLGMLTAANDTEHTFEGKAPLNNVYDRGILGSEPRKMTDFKVGAKALTLLGNHKNETSTDSVFMLTPDSSESGDGLVTVIPKETMEGLEEFTLSWVTRIYKPQGGGFGLVLFYDNAVEDGDISYFNGYDNFSYTGYKGKLLNEYEAYSVYDGVKTQYSAAPLVTTHPVNSGGEANNSVYSMVRCIKGEFEHDGKTYTAKVLSYVDDQLVSVSYAQWKEAPVMFRYESEGSGWSVQFGRLKLDEYRRMDVPAAEAIEAARPLHVVGTSAFTGEYPVEGGQVYVEVRAKDPNTVMVSSGNSNQMTGVPEGEGSDKMMGDGDGNPDNMPGGSVSCNTPQNNSPNSVSCNKPQNNSPNSVSCNTPQSNSPNSVSCNKPQNNSPNSVSDNTPQNNSLYSASGNDALKLRAPSVTNSRLNSIQVNYMCRTQKVGEETLEAEEGVTYISASCLKTIPYQYEIVPYKRITPALRFYTELKKDDVFNSSSTHEVGALLIEAEKFAGQLDIGTEGAIVCHDTKEVSDSGDVISYRSDFNSKIVAGKQFISRAYVKYSIGDSEFYYYTEPVKASIERAAVSEGIDSAAEEVKEACAEIEVPYELKLMSFNILTSATKKAEVYNNIKLTRAQRMEAAAAMIQQLHPDVTGLMEVSDEQAESIRNDSVFEDYELIGSPAFTQLHEQGVYILYDKTKFDLEDWGVKYLSENPDEEHSYIKEAEDENGSGRLDIAGGVMHQPRKAVYAVLCNKANGRKLAFVATHLGHTPSGSDKAVSDLIRCKQAKTLVDLILEGGMFDPSEAFVIAGDMNSQPNLAPYQEYRRVSEDARYSADIQPDGYQGTLHSYKKKIASSLLDYIFVSAGDYHCSEFDVITKEYPSSLLGMDILPSDHYAVMADVVLLP